MPEDPKVLYCRLAEELSDTVTRLCVIHTGSYADAEDCYQNVFFKLYRELCKKDIPDPRAWIIRVTLNECRSLFRYTLRRRTVGLEELTGSAEDPSDLEILDIIYRLPPKYRDVIYLYYYEQLTVEEIAAATGTKTNTVKSQLKRGREKLKRYLDDGERSAAE